MRYYFRIAIPKALRSELNQREIRRTLHTQDYQTALLRSLQYAEKFKIYFGELMIKHDPLAKHLSISTTTHANGDVTEKFDFDDDNIALDKERFEMYQSTKSNIQPTPQPASSVTPQPTSLEAPTAAPISNSSFLLSQAVQDYIDEKITLDVWKRNTASEYTNLYPILVGIVGDRPLESVTRDDAKRFIVSLKKMRNKNGNLFTDGVINKRVGLMSSVYKHYIQEQKATYNPFSGLQLKIKVNAKTLKSPYNDDELKRLFDPQVFKLNSKKPSRYWLPLIMLYTGMRPSEIAVLEEGDFITKDNRDCINISDGKTKNAVRCIPIVKNLILLGLLDYVQKIRNSSSKDRRLFKELTSGIAKPAGAVSNWWNVTHHKNCRIVNSVKTVNGKLTTTRNVSLYSLRHVVSDKMSSRGVSVEHRGEILGHETGKSETAKVYGSADIERMLLNLSLVKYDILLYGVSSNARTRKL